MGLGQKINNILEYKITIDLNAQLKKKKALRIIGAVTVALLILGYVVGEMVFWGVDNRNVFDRQIEVLEKRRVENPDNIKNKVDLAMAYYLNGKENEAQNLFEEVLGEDKDNAVANIYYGLILADRKQYRDAIPLLLRGIKRQPRTENLAYIYLGISYYELGGVKEALSYLDTGTKLDPGSALGHYYLGLVYKKQGNKNNAKTALEKALELSGNNYPEAAKALNELK